MSERADEKLVETLLKSIKAISRKHVEEKVDSYVVTIPLGVILPFCCDSNKKDTPDFSFAKCNFSLKYVNKLKRDAKRLERSEAINLTKKKQRKTKRMML